MTTDTGPDPKGARNAVPASERDALAAIAHGTIPDRGNFGTVAALSTYDCLERAVDAILAAGYRRVVEDAEAVERVAAAIHDEQCNTQVEPAERHVHGDHVFNRYPDIARAALAALRGGE